MLEGKKTYIGIIVSALGLFGVAKYFGGEIELAKLIDLVMQVAGLLIAAYGRFAVTKE